MNTNRDIGLTFSPEDRAVGLRPLTARSLLASMLLGTYPPRLPVRALVASAELFGIKESSCRTALSRMVAAGEVTTEDGWYELGSNLAERQRQQDEGRQARRTDWDDTWRLKIVGADRRSPSERATARRVLTASHYAELREGVWTRPTNLTEDQALIELVDRGWHAGVVNFETPPAVGQLWPLPLWQQRADGLIKAIDTLTPGLESGDQSALARGFVVAAATLRHFRSDPLLPDPLLPDGWNGQELRTRYDRFDLSYRKLLRTFLRDH